MLSQRWKWLVWILFGAYGLLMLWLMIFGRIGDPQVAGQMNLRPFQTLGRFAWVLRHSSDDELRRNAWANLLGNVALFVPLGVFLPTLFSRLRHFGRFFLLSLALVLTLELIQLGTGLGTLDIDDLLLNLPGACLGYFLLFCTNKTSRA